MTTTDVRELTAFGRHLPRAREVVHRSLQRALRSAHGLLYQLTANVCGRPVLARPVEAGALGNVLVQSRTLGVIDGDLAALGRPPLGNHPIPTYQSES
jgi:hypothetical protein